MAGNQRGPTGAQPQSGFLASLGKGGHQDGEDKVYDSQQGMNGLPDSSFVTLLLNFYGTKSQKDLSEKTAG